MGCSHSDKTTKLKRVNGFVIRLAPFSAAENEPCRAQFIDARGKIVFSAADWGLSVVLAGKDVNGDGIPDVVLEGYSGGAHCCWTYYIISLGANPRLLSQFYNQQAAEFVSNRAGRIEIHTSDGAFDYFESPHAFSPIPDIYLRLEGNRLVDISRERVADYDKEIAEIKAEISAEDLAALRQAKSKDEIIDREEVAMNALRIVLAYLYSGRQAEAHAALKKMWPAFDQDRIWKLILETRRKGILRYTRTNNT
ncbi:MAG TPA: VCBS repeat-containing protein [Candidatus Angelobacter sp.]|nr:VCBS repeat-containing protein [Candidatus Angelobacter sp.]